MTRRVVGQLTDAEFREEARENHIWLNAFACINPSPAFLRDVGEMIVEKLRTTNLHTDGFGEPDKKGHRAGESPMIVLTVNKS